MGSPVPRTRAAIIVSASVASMFPPEIPRIPLASLRPSPVADTTPTTIPTVAQASATGMALLAASTRIDVMRPSPMRVSLRTQLAATPATRAQKPANMGERPSAMKYTSTAGAVSRWRSRLITAPSRGRSARDMTGSPWRFASKWTITPTATK